MISAFLNYHLYLTTLGFPEAGSGKPITEQYINN